MVMPPCAMKKEYMLESTLSASTHQEKKAFMSATAKRASACMSVVRSLMASDACIQGSSGRPPRVWILSVCMQLR